MKDKLRYKEGTVNGVKVDDENGSFIKGVSTSTLIKVCIFCLIALVIFFVLYFIVKKSVNFNGVYYETPSNDEVIEVVVGAEGEDSQEQVNLKLKGELVVEIEKGTEWKDPGFVATSDTAGDISEHVKVSGKVDVNKEGTYEIVYELDYKVIAPKLTRLVKVVKKVNNNQGGNSSSGGSGENNSGSSKPSTINLSLVGNDTVYLVTGSTYNDEGASAVDNLGNNVSNKITRSGSVNTSVAGTYKLTYSVTNYDGQVLTVVRNVVVQSMVIDLTSTISGSSAIINVVTNVDNFGYILFPNGTKSTKQNDTYTVSKNGTYEFMVYNNNGNSRKATITINNIPTSSSPSVTCSISNVNGKSEITVNVSSSTAISYYTYSGTNYTTNTFSVKKIPSGSRIIVSATYVNGKSSTAVCVSP